MKQLVNEMIKQKREYLNNGNDCCDTSDILTTLMAATYSNGENVPDDLVFDECINFLLAGHGTTSSIIGSFCYSMVQNPHIQDQLIAEIDQLKDIDPERYPLEFTGKVEELRLLNTCVKETLRLNPPVPKLAKKAGRDTTIQGIKICKGVSYFEYCSSRLLTTNIDKC
jgi:cytochrome P450/NADPH-cytochrome P450 reductase